MKSFKGSTERLLPKVTGSYQSSLSRKGDMVRSALKKIHLRTDWRIGWMGEDEAGRPLELLDY